MVDRRLLKKFLIDLHANDLRVARHGRFCALDERSVVSGNATDAPSNARTDSDNIITTTILFCYVMPREVSSPGVF